MSGRQARLPRSVSLQRAPLRDTKDWDEQRPGSGTDDSRSQSRAWVLGHIREARSATFLRRPSGRMGPAGGCPSGVARLPDVSRQAISGLRRQMGRQDSTDEGLYAICTLITHRFATPSRPRSLLHPDSGLQLNPEPDPSLSARTLSKGVGSPVVRTAKLHRTPVSMRRPSHSLATLHDHLRLLIDASPDLRSVGTDSYCENARHYA